MGVCVCGGAMIKCAFGVAPSSLMVPPGKTMTKMPIANVLDNKPNVNIPPFGMCNNPANPATVKPPPVMFAPAPCVPVTLTPWAPGSPTVLVNNFPAINNSSTLMCMWGGVITIVNPGQATILVP